MSDPATIAKTLGAAGGVAAAAPVVVIFGVELGMLTAAAVGALLSLAYSRPAAVTPKKPLPESPPFKRLLVLAGRASAMAFTLTALAIVSAWTAMALPHVPGGGWAAKLPAEPFAGLLAFGGQYVLPRALALANSWVAARVTK